MEQMDITQRRCPTCGSTHLQICQAIVSQQSLHVLVENNSSVVREKTGAVEDGANPGYSVQAFIVCRPAGHIHVIELLSIERGVLLQRVIEMSEVQAPPDMIDKMELARAG